jgi:hypothetical protein
LADIGLPGGKSGDAFTLECRIRFPWLPVIVVTGFDAGDYKHLEDDPKVCIVQKPTTIGKVGDCLNRLLQRDLDVTA